MKLKRRSFIASCIGGVMAAVLPFRIGKANPKFRPYPGFVQEFAYREMWINQTPIYDQMYQLAGIRMTGQFNACLPGDYPTPPWPPRLVSQAYDKYLKLSPGFKRISIDWTLDRFKKTLDFEIVDMKDQSAPTFQGVITGTSQVKQTNE